MGTVGSSSLCNPNKPRRPTDPARNNFRGFTLIELMIAASILAILAMIALPKFSNMIIKAKEASVKGSLGSVRSALTLYYAENEGTWPDSTWGLDGTLSPRYIDSIPYIRIPQDTTPGGNEFMAGCGLAEGHCSIGWVYCTDAGGSALSSVKLSCKRKMVSGDCWSNL